MLKNIFFFVNFVKDRISSTYIIIIIIIVIMIIIFVRTVIYCYEFSEIVTKLDKMMKNIKYRTSESSKPDDSAVKPGKPEHTSGPRKAVKHYDTLYTWTFFFLPASVHFHCTAVYFWMDS